MNRLVVTSAGALGLLLIAGCHGAKGDRSPAGVSPPVGRTVAVEIDDCELQVSLLREVRQPAIQVLAATVRSRCRDGESTTRETLWRLDAPARRRGGDGVGRRYLFFADLVGRSPDFLPLLRAVARRIDIEATDPSESFMELAPIHRRQLLDDGLLRAIAIAPSFGDAEHRDGYRVTFAMTDGGRIILEIDADDGDGWWAQLVE